METALLPSIDEPQRRPARKPVAGFQNEPGFSPLQILLIDGCRMTRETLTSTLLKWPRIADVVAVRDCAEGLEALREKQPDLVLIVADRWIGDVAAAVRAMRQIDLSCPIIILAAKQYDLDVREALRSGVSGYLVDCRGLPALAAAIDAAVAGSRPFSESIRSLLSWPKGHPRLARVRSPRASGLHRRGLDMLFLLGKGASHKEAATALGISAKTADHHKCRLMRRLGIHDRVELACFAIREGLVSPT